jgi:hypothetical protein
MSDDDEKKDDSSNLTVMTGSAIAPPRPPNAKMMQADRVRERIIELRDRMTDDYFEMGRLLFYAQKQGIYRLWNGPDGNPYETFSDYVEHEVSFKYRKAKYLMSIWWWFGEQLQEEVFDKIRDIGWTKAAALVGVVDEKNADAWVAKASEMKVKELESEVRHALEKAGRKRPTIDVTTSSGKGHVKAPEIPAGKEKSPTPPASSKIDEIAEGADTNAISSDSIRKNLDGSPVTAGFSHPAPMSGAPESVRQGVDPLTDGEVRLHRSLWRCMMDGEQQANVEKAIDMASKVAGVESDGKGYLLDLIATHFLAMFNLTSPYNEEGKKEAFRHEVLKAVENSFRIDIVALERGTMNVVHGAEVLEKAEKEGEG